MKCSRILTAFMAVFIIVAAGLPCKAQEKTNDLIGLYGGISVNTFSYTDQTGFEGTYKSRTGYTAGFSYHHRIYKGLFLQSGLLYMNNSYEATNRKAVEASAINPALFSFVLFDYRKTYTMLQMPIVPQYYFEDKKMAIGLGAGIGLNQVLAINTYNYMLRRSDILNQKEDWFFVSYKAVVTGRYSLSDHISAMLQLSASLSQNTGFIENRAGAELGIGVMYSL